MIYVSQASSSFPDQVTRLFNMLQFLQRLADGSQFDFTKLNAQVNIIPVISKACPVPLHRLSPSQGNIRIKSSDEDIASHPPTPIYNTRLLQCLAPKRHLLSVHALKQDSPAFVDALALLRIWANQRGYGEGSKFCVQGFKGKGSWWSALLQLLISGEEPLTNQGKGLTRRPLGRGLSSYQMFRAALDVLGQWLFRFPNCFALNHIFIHSQI